MPRIFGRKADHRNHLLRNLVTSLILFETIDTTQAKAKEIKPIVDKIITAAKKADLTATRTLSAYLFDTNAVRKAIKELAPRYSTRTSGFTKSYHLKNRNGDDAQMMRLELIDKKVFIEPKVELKKDDKETKKEKNAK